MVKTKHAYPDWAIKYRQTGREVRFLNSKYYLYEISSRYDPSKKRSVKVTGKLLGRITESGFIESEKRKLLEVKSVSHREYGLSQFILNRQEYMEKLKNYFPKEWRQIMLMSYGRLLHQSPLKRMPDCSDRSWLSKELGISLNRKSITEVLKSLGKAESLRSEYMKSFLSKQDYLLIDSTYLRTTAEDSTIVKEGYSKEHTWEKQASLLYLYSRKFQQPVYYRLLAGNVRDVKSLSLTLKEIGIDDVTIIADKGFFSENNIHQLQKNNMKYIIPLRRNSKLVDYSGLCKNDDLFPHLDTFVWFKKTKWNNGFVYLFSNLLLAAQEKKDYLSRTFSLPDDYSYNSYTEKEDTYGTLAVYSNLDLKPQEIYSLYKTRLYIEQVFDVLKTVLSADSPYLQDDDVLQGWMFINHIALQWCYELLTAIKKNKLSNKISIKDAILRLSEVRKILINNEWYNAENTKNEASLIGSLLS